MESNVTAKTLSALFSNVAVIDILVCFFLTIPIFIAYIVLITLYFHKSDKAVNNKTHGLSRFSLAGVFIIFGMIIFDMNVEFISAMLISLNNYKKLDFEKLKPLMSSVMFINFIDQYRKIPFSILVGGNLLCTALYSGAEGLISSLKTLKVPVGMCIELPELKRRRMKFIFLVWIAVAVLATIYTMIIGSDDIDFEVGMCYSGVITTLAIIILADRSPTVLQNFTTDTTDTTTVNTTDSTETNYVETSTNMDDAIDHVSDVAIKIIERINPGYTEETSSEKTVQASTESTTPSVSVSQGESL